MKVLITGGTGVLGSELQQIFNEKLCPPKTELDIKNKKTILDYFKKNDFDTVIHTAALTKIRTCEENKNLCWETNVQGTRNIIETILETRKNIKFVYVSTACVFSGFEEMYVESSIPYPENFYALTKLLGEFEVKKLPSHLIIRTNFVGKKKWPYPKAFTDRFGTYLFSNTVAKGIKDVIKENLEGIIHVVGDKKISMFELAKLTTPDIEPMTMKEYSGPRLTIDMSLDTERWKKYKIIK